MAFGGGNYRDYNKGMPGTYTNTITIGAPVQANTRGITAGGVKMDWGADGEVFELTRDQFLDHPVDYTGYPESDDHNILLREIFKHADTFIGYKINSTGSLKASNPDVGEALYSGSAGNKITVTAYKNINDDTKMDISTYFDGVLKDVQTVDIVTPLVAKVTKGDEQDGSDKPEDVGEVTITSTFEDNKITVRWEGVNSEYTVKPLLMMGNAICAMIPGRIEEEKTENSVSYIFGPEAAKTDYKVNVRVQKQGESSYKTLKTVGFNMATEPGTISGADSTKLEDNNFVKFSKIGVIQENAGYAFTGGRSGSNITGQCHQELLAALEGYTFNTLFCDSDVENVKKVYVEFTKRLRDQRGIYFQTVVHDYVDADYEGVISVNNAVAPGQFNNASSLVCWVAGYSSAIALNNELTSKQYDGELDIDVSKSDLQNEMLFKQGHFLFHKVSMDEKYTLIDVNSLTTFTTEHNVDMSQNKVIRVVDYIHNEASYLINRVDIGSLPNTPAGRTSLWNQVVAICEGLQADGVIQNFTDQDVTVSEIEGQRNAVKVDLRIQVVGTIRYVYITSYIIGE